MYRLMYKVMCYRESSQVTTNTREILFNGADGITLVNHADVVIMHETQIHFAASEHTFDSEHPPLGGGG